jgi:hypothetical protein
MREMPQRKGEPQADLRRQARTVAARRDRTVPPRSVGLRDRISARRAWRALWNETG